MKRTEIWDSYHIIDYLREHFIDFRTLYIHEAERLSPLSEGQLEDKMEMLKRAGIHMPNYTGRSIQGASTRTLQLQRYREWIAGSSALLRMTKNLVLQDGTVVKYRDKNTIKQAVFVAVQMAKSSTEDISKADMKFSYTAKKSPPAMEQWTAIEIAAYLNRHMNEYEAALLNILYLHYTNKAGFRKLVKALYGQTKGLLTASINNSDSALSFAATAAALTVIQEPASKEKRDTIVGAETADDLKAAVSDIREISVSSKLKGMSEDERRQYVLRTTLERQLAKHSDSAKKTSQNDDA